MTLVYADRVQESTTTTGTGAYALAGANTGYQSFAAIGNGNTCYYGATDGTSWEVGLGTYTLSGTTLARTSILASSNSNAAVSWGAGTKTIWCDFPALVASYLAGGTTGSGAVALANSPTFVTPTLGAAAGTSLSLTALTASSAVATDASKNLVSVTNTGTGNNVLATSPALVTPALGTPSALVLTNATGTPTSIGLANGTGLPVSTGVSGLGTGVATFLGTPTSANLAAALTDETGSGAAVFANSPTLVTPALGTPSAVVLTSGTGLPVASGISGLGTGIATFLATPSSANLATAITDETGSGALVFATSPTLVTPTIGVATATSVNKVAITAPATSATLTIANGKTLTANNTITLAGTDSSTYTFPGASATIPAYATNTWTPALSFAGSSTGIAYSTQTGNYYEIGGQIVIAAFTIVCTSIGALSGAARVTLPVVPANAQGAFILSTSANLASISGEITGVFTAADGRMQFAQQGAAATAVLQFTNFTNTSAISGICIYAV